MKKLFVLFIALLLIVSTVSGCTQKDGDETSDAQGKKITFLHIWPEYKELIEGICKDYETKTGTTVQITVVPYDQVDRTIQNQISSDNLNDVFFQWTKSIPSPWLSDASTKDSFLDLTPYLNADASWKSKFDMGTWDSGVYQGKYYNMPFRSSAYLIYYNKTIFKKYGLNVPKNIEELETLMKTLKQNDPNKIPLCLFSMGSTGTLLQYVSALTSYVDEFTGLNVDKSYGTGRIKPDPNDTYTPAAYEKVKYYLDNGFFGKAMTYNSDSALSKFTNAEAAMCLVNNNNFSTVKENMKAGNDIGIFAWPGPKSKEDLHYIFGTFDGFSVNNHSQNKDVAVDFLKYLSSDEVQNKFAKETDSIMMNKNVLYTDDMQKQLKTSMEGIPKFSSSFDFTLGNGAGQSQVSVKDYFSGSYAGTAKDMITKIHQNTYQDIKDAGLDYVELSKPLAKESDTGTGKLLNDYISWLKSK